MSSCSHYLVPYMTLLIQMLTQFICNISAAPLPAQTVLVSQHQPCSCHMKQPTDCTINTSVCVCRLTLSVQRADLTVSFTAHYTEGFKGCSLILSDILSIITQNEKSTEQLALISTFIVGKKTGRGGGLAHTEDVCSRSWRWRYVK